MEANEKFILQYVWPWNHDSATPNVFIFECWTISVFKKKYFFLFLSNIWTAEKFSEYKHFCFYWVYIFKMAGCLALNKQASKTLSWAILATNVCVMYVFMCVSNPVKADWISVSGKEI